MMADIRDNNSEQVSTLVILQQARSLTEVILIGHRYIEDVLDQYVQQLVPNRQALRTELLTYGEKLELVLADVDLASWGKEDGEDDVDYIIAKEMLAVMAVLNGLRAEVSIEIVACIYPDILERRVSAQNIADQARQLFALSPSTAEETVRSEVAGHIACVHAYFESFTGATFG